MTGPAPDMESAKGARLRADLRWTSERDAHRNGPDGVCPIDGARNCDEFKWYARALASRGWIPAPDEPVDDLQEAGAAVSGGA